MTFDETVERRGNGGDHRYVITEVDITSLGAAGAESYDAEARHSLTNAHGIVLDQEDPALEVSYDPDAAEIVVRNLSDGAATADATDVGTVTLKFVGDYSA